MAIKPFMLTLGPPVAAIAAGNTAVVKPSEVVSEATAAVVAEMIPKFLDPDAVAVATGGIPETSALLDQHWDLIFFTGSPAIGKIIHQAAAKHLTPTGARNRLGRESDRLGQRAARPTRTVRLQRRRVGRREHPRADKLRRRLRQRLLRPPADRTAAIRRRREYHGHWGFEAFTNARGVLYHSALIDPGVKYAPYAEHQTERKVMSKLL